MKIVSLEPTPNPNAFKFNVDEELSKGMPRSYQNAEAAEPDPLAKEIFAIEGVESVFYLGSFLTVTKDEESDWEEVVKATGHVLLEFDTSLLETIQDPTQTEDGEQGELYGKINEILDEMVRPALAGDGGGLELLGIDGSTVFIRYQGACGTCPSATTGTLMAIERLLQHQIDPEMSVVPA